MKENNSHDSTLETPSGRNNIPCERNPKFERSWLLSCDWTITVQRKGAAFHSCHRQVVLPLSDVLEDDIIRKKDVYVDPLCNFLGRHKKNKSHLLGCLVWGSALWAPDSPSMSFSKMAIWQNKHWACVLLPSRCRSASPFNMVFTECWRWDGGLFLCVEGIISTIGTIQADTRLLIRGAHYHSFVSFCSCAQILEF